MIKRTFGGQCLTGLVLVFSHHPGPARPRQSLKHGALHPGCHQNDQQHAEPTRSAPLGSCAPRLSGCHGSGSRGGGYLPPPWRSVSTGIRRSSRVRRATHHGRHHGVPDGGARGGMSSNAMSAARRASLTTRVATRHCPKCQGLARAQWLAERQAELLSVPYFHVVFTLPAPVGEIAFQNKALVYTILFHAAAETLATIAADPKHLGAQLEVTMVLHTWGQTPPACPLHRAGQWPFPRQHTLDRLQKRLLLAGARPLAAIPPVVPTRPAEGLRYRQSALLRQTLGSRRSRGLRRSSRCAPALGLSTPSPHSADPNRC